MIPDLSLLSTASAMARHAGHVHAAVADNLARADVPGARAATDSGFADALDRMAAGQALRAPRTGDRIVLDDQMVTMASNAGRHDAAVSLYAKALEMVRLAGSSPR